MEYILIGIIILLFVLLLLGKKKSSTIEKLAFQYKKRAYFFTKNELKFYCELVKETTDLNLVLFAKVRLADIIEPKEKGKQWQSQFNRIKSKHVDFVLCDLPSVKPVLVIELDDSSHDRPDRLERDSFVDKALSQARIPIIHTRNSSGLKEKIANAVSEKQSIKV